MRPPERTIPLVLGDIRPDYVDLIRELKGQVIPLGKGRGYLNVLDPGEAHEAAQLLTESSRVELAAAVDAEAELAAMEQASAGITDEATLLDMQLQAADLVQVAVKNRTKGERAESLATEVLEDAHNRRRRWCRHCCRSRAGRPRPTVKSRSSTRH